ncbi:MAG TPA: pitrilysin family protein [Terriglobales bacterium]|nr:pitrilysin family protein [Terriglobales bacterium]
MNATAGNTDNFAVILSAARLQVGRKGISSLSVILSAARTAFARAGSKDPYHHTILSLRVKRATCFPLLALLCLLLLTTLCPAQQPLPWNKIQAPPLPAFTPKEPTRITLSNGMVIFLQPDHELPLISAVARIRGGSVSEPPGKTGLADIYGEVWRTGGTTTLTGDQMDDFLEAHAAKIETDDQNDSTTISLNCLKADFNAVFKMYLDLLHNPAFRPDKIELAKRQAYTAISRRNDNVDDIVHRESLIIAYGKNNPYASVPEYASVAAVTRQDLLNWHQQYVHPNNIIFGITGDFDPKAMEATLRKAFASWPKGPQARQPEVRFNPPKPGLYFVQKNDINQTTIAMLDLGIERSNPDYYAVTVMNEIFGGGFSSRLFNNLRTVRGLAYSVGGGVGSDWNHPGLTDIEMQTKSASTVEGIQGLNGQIDDLLQHPPTPEELQRAKDDILNSFIFRFDTPEKVLREKMAYEFYHYPLDFLEKYRSGVEKVTAEDVARVAKKYIHKDQLAVLVVGNDAQFGTPLSTLGPVQKVDIAIPPPPAAMMGVEEPGARAVE